MRQKHFWITGAMLLLSGSVRAQSFTAIGTIKSVDADKRMLFVNAGGQDRQVPIADNAKILGNDGNALMDGLKSAQLKEGTIVTLTLERVGDSPPIREIQLGRHEVNAQAGGRGGQNASAAGKSSVGFKENPLAKRWFLKK